MKGNDTKPWVPAEQDVVVYQGEDYKVTKLWDHSLVMTYVDLEAVSALIPNTNVKMFHLSVHISNISPK
jgi:hypothetical protein